MSKTDFNINIETFKALFIGHDVQVEWIDKSVTDDSITICFSDEIIIELTITGNIMVRKKGIW
jgi:hypothetical protein